MADAFPLYSSYTALGWRKVKYIDFAGAEAAVATGALVRVYDGLGAHHGYQLVDNPGITWIPSEDSTAAITARESAANAGLCGASATEHLPEEKRLHREDRHTHKPLPAEDFIELAQAKVRLQTCSVNKGGDKATRVYPKAVEVKKAQGKTNVSNGSHPDHKP
jgi:hypothetical protein